MKKRTYSWSVFLVLFALLICNILQAQILEDDLILSSQAAVNSFNYTEVTGNLTIEGADINDLSPLSILTLIGEDLIIQNNEILTNLNGMQNLTSVGVNLGILNNNLLMNIDALQNISSIGRNIVVDDNDELTTLEGLNNITIVEGYLKILSNEKLENLDGLQNITSVDGTLEINNNDAIVNLYGLRNITSTIGYINISSNDELTNINSLQKITDVNKSLSISNNDKLANLEGLHNIESVGTFLKVEKNNGITNLEGLRNITSIGGYLNIFDNEMLANLDGLQNLLSVGGDVDIYDNVLLNRFCGLYPLLNNGDYLGAFSVYDNAANPTEQDIIDGGTCSEENTHPEIVLSINAPTILLEDDFSQSCGICNVSVTVKDFANVGNVSLKLSYNLESLNYTGVTINSELTNPVYMEDAGIFSMTYSGEQISLDDDDVLFTLHFSVVPNITGTLFSLVWSNEQGDCECAGPGGEPVYSGVFNNHSSVLITDELPEITCLADIEVENDAGICGAIVNYVAPVGIDNCPDPITIQTEGIASGEIFPTGETINTFLVTDSQGNTAECSFVVTVTDTEAPEFIDCPENVIATTGENRTTCDQLVTWIPPTAVDNCEVLSLTSDFDPEDIFSVGTTTVNYTATDNSEVANTATCSFTITVIDDTAPEIICLANQERGTDDPSCNYTIVGAEFEPTSINDNCEITEQTYELTGVTEIDKIEATTLEGVILNKGVTTVNWFVKDAAGNSSECLFSVTIVDDDAPTIGCIENQTRGTANLSCEYITIGNEFDLFSKNDNCEIVEQSYELSGATIVDLINSTTLDGVAFNKGVTTVNWIAKDAAGNVSDCSFDVIVVDDDVPIITVCAPEQSAIVTDGCSAEMPNFINTVVATDNCEVVTITQSPAFGDWLSFADSPYSVTITVADNAGNTTTCTTTFTLLKASVGGKLLYNNVAQSPMNNVTLAISPFGDNETCTTDDNGDYLFTGLCAGSYSISVIGNAKPVGYINATDAGAVNKWGTVGGEISYVNFLAGDVAENNFYLNSTDALRIQKYFVEGLSFDKSEWIYWAKDVEISSNAESKPENFDVDIGGDDFINYNISAICTGDFNGSFSPDPLKSVVSLLSLQSKNSLKVLKNQIIELPLLAGFDMEIGAVSLVLDFPNKFMKVLDVKVNGSNVPPNWALKDNELRIGWNSVEPVSVLANEPLVTLILKTSNTFKSGQSTSIALINDPLNELADGNNNVIRGAIIKTSTLSNGGKGINEEMEIEGLSFINYPNPFKNATTIQYSLPFDGKVNINVYNSLGQLVNVLINAKQKSGQYSIRNYGIELQPGVYIAKLRLFNQSNDLTRVIKLQVLN